MSKDQIYGCLIFIVSLAITIFYIGIFLGEFIGITFLASLKWWAIALPVILLVLAVLAILMWIGWTMLTTPPPTPLEQETSIETEESKAEQESKD
ncbi:MAG: transcriptional regulator [Candidatus Bathyarchaeia archaeon]